MFRNNLSLQISTISLISLIFILTLGCSVLGSSLNPSPTPTPTEPVGVGPEGNILVCPEEDTLFSLWFSHLAVLDIDAGGGETFYLKFENQPPSFFDLWIYPDGTISNEGILQEAPIAYNGTANHPNDSSCPVQTFEGVWQMKATITGTCKDDVVKIHIIEEWVNPELHSSCGDAIGPGPGLYSAPELDLVFDLNDPYPADSVEIPEGGVFHATYAYYLWLAGYEPPKGP